MFYFNENKDNQYSNNNSISTGLLKRKISGGKKIIKRGLNIPHQAHLVLQLPLSSRVWPAGRSSGRWPSRGSFRSQQRDETWGAICRSGRKSALKKYFIMNLPMQM